MVRGFNLINHGQLHHVDRSAVWIVLIDHPFRIQYNSLGSNYGAVRQRVFTPPILRGYDVHKFGFSRWVIAQPNLHRSCGRGRHRWQSGCPWCGLLAPVLLLFDITNPRRAGWVTILSHFAYVVTKMHRWI